MTSVPSFDLDEALRRVALAIPNLSQTEKGLCERLLHNGVSIDAVISVIKADRMRAQIAGEIEDRKAADAQQAEDRKLPQNDRPRLR